MIEEQSSATYYVLSKLKDNYSQIQNYSLDPQLAIAQKYHEEITHDRDGCDRFNSPLDTKIILSKLRNCVGSGREQWDCFKIC